MPAIRGQAFNIGGGPANTISLLELLALIGDLHGRRPDVRFGGWRSGDQRYYVSDTARFFDQQFVIGDGKASPGDPIAGR